MAVAPQTNLFLLKCPLGLNNKHQLTFDNKEAQLAYFLSLSKLEIDNISYQRKDNIIRYPAHIDTILEYNYCIYENENYTTKWFYAFITNMRYVNDNMTEITIATDVWQTWQFDLTLKQSFVEREMINPAEDVAGSNLVPEGLETGEMIINNSYDMDNLDTINVIAYTGDTLPRLLYASTDVDVPIKINQGAYTVNGIISTVCFILSSNQTFMALMNALQRSNYSDYVLTCFTVPKLAVEEFLIPANRVQDETGYAQYTAYILQNGTQYTQNEHTLTLNALPSTIDGYTPKNKKLLTYPYNYLAFNPSSGTQKIYRYEDFNGSPIFTIVSEVNINPQVAFIPKNYRNKTNQNITDYSVLDGYPTLSYRNDTFNSWLAQNSQIIDLNLEQEQFNYGIGQVQNALGGTGQIVGDALSMNFGGAISTGINTPLNMIQNDINHEYYIKNQMAQIEKQKLVPDKVNMAGSNGTLLGYGYNNKSIFVNFSIKKQFAQKIDKYFDMYGYALNLVKIPDIGNRPNWNYIKTIGCNIIANIPQGDLEVIKNMFNNGFTLWHNPATFQDYSQNNK